MSRMLYLLFVLSGAAGLMYESIWTRYLGLFVGHDAYAQIIVLVIFLGGMSAGAMVVSRWSERLTQPLYGYVAVEFVVGCIGLVFHDLFQATSGWAYASLYPALAGSWTLIAGKWAIASALILPQSLLLGATFPLMSAGVLRLRGDRPGRTLALLYFGNSLGAASGVLVAGFYLVQVAGLPGTLLAAGMLNLVVACATVGVIVAARNRGAEPAIATTDAPPAVADRAGSYGLPRLLLFASFATAVASFLYEIAWIRMLALVLGSATHSFELMLSAFILGLALGAWWIGPRADGLADPLKTLGIVQWVMGGLALATLPLYLHSFGWIAALIGAFSPTDAGYTGFTLARYAICLLIMLPATFCAGMTLPLITRTLLGMRSGERAIGAVFAWNTLGSIVGVIAGGLLLLPAIGLQAMLLAGAVVDMLLGVLLLGRSRMPSVRRRRVVPVAAAAIVAVVILVGISVRLDPALLSSGVYRTGTMIKPGEREVRFYRDGRTATVSGISVTGTGYLSLATNGKTDASLPRAWFQPCDSVTTPGPLGADAATQTLLPLVTLAHAPKARTAAVIGQGSGMSTHLLLGSHLLSSVETIEIEPEMIRGSRIFYPANRRTFDDPRSHFIIDDAKSHFASAQRRYDLIMSEPSNPWVSGVAGLFSIEFYARIREYLTPDGVFGQWLHVYELDDPLVLTVLAALHRNFQAYEIYLVPSGDLLVVAGNRPVLPNPDWSVVRLPGLKADLCRFAPLTPSTLDALHLVGRAELAPLLAHSQPNSDFYPILDLGAERRRFRRDYAIGFPALSTEWFNLISSLRQRRTPVGIETRPAIPENPRVRARALGALLRSAAVSGSDQGTTSTDRQALYQWQLWRATVARGQAPGNWESWLDQVSQIDRLRNGGAAGMADEELYAELEGVVSRWSAPQPVRDVLAFRRALSSWDFPAAAAAGDRLIPVAMKERRWITADELRDGVVMARLHGGDVAGARRDLDALAPFSTRRPGDLRSLLLDAYVRSVEPTPTTITRR